MNLVGAKATQYMFHKCPEFHVLGQVPKVEAFEKAEAERLSTGRSVVPTARRLTAGDWARAPAASTPKARTRRGTVRART